VQWGRDGDRAAIQASSGTVLIRGCEFRQNKLHISLEEAVNCAIISGNIFKGTAKIATAPQANVQIGLNAGY